jgi:hypothetical protein
MEHHLSGGNRFEVQVLILPGLPEQPGTPGRNILRPLPYIILGKVTAISPTITNILLNRDTTDDLCRSPFDRVTVIQLLNDNRGMLV